MSLKNEKKFNSIMSRKDKLLKRLLSLPDDFTFNEIVSLLGFFKFFETKMGKTTGSAVRFKNEDFPNEPIIFHKPHPRPIMKIYVLKSIAACLIRCKLINNKDERTGRNEK